MTTRLSIRGRLTSLFAASYFVTGTILVVISYFLVRDRLRSGADEVRLAQLGLDGIPGGGSVIPPTDGVASDGRPLQQVIIDDLRLQLVDEVLDTLLLWSILAVIVVGAISIVFGHLTSRRALDPVRQVTHTAQRLSETNLDERVRYDGPPDELSELADTFDAMLDRLQTSVDSQRQFTAIASHELRTPLARIQAAAELTRTAPEVMGEGELAATVEPAAIHAGQLINRLLQLTRSQAGKRDRSDVDLLAVWRGAVDAIQPEARQLDITIELEVSGHDFSVSADPLLMESLAENLVQNAVHHNSVGGVARFALSSSPSEIVIDASNSGEVISDQDLERMALPFERNTSNPDRIGHGLGTTIVRSIVRAHNGVLNFDARPEGGLRVHVQLPRDSSLTTPAAS